MRTGRSNTQKNGNSTLLIAQTSILCLVMSLAPLIAARLSPIPSLSMQMLVLVASVLWVVRSYREGAITLPNRWISALIIALSAFLLLSAWRSASLYLTIRELLSVFSYLLLFLMCCGLGSERKAVYAVIGSLCLSAMIVGLLGVREYVLTGGGGWRVFSTFYNPDFLAGFAGMMLPVALGWYFSRTALASSLVSWLSILYLLAAVLMTGSRFGALCAVVGVVVFCILVISSGSVKRVRLARVFLLIVPLLVVYAVLSRPLTERVASTKAESHSGGFRVHTWKGTAYMAAANPINGTGLGTYSVAYPKYAVVGFTRLAHNTYLQVAAEAGIPASILLILLLASASLTPLTLTLRWQEANETSGWMPDKAVILSGLMGGAAASMARNMVDSDWYVTAIGLGFWAILGAIISLSGVGSRSVSLSQPKAGGAIGILVLTLVSLSFILIGESMSAMGDLGGKRNPESAIRFYRLAAKFEPLNADYHRRLAGLYPSASGLFDSASSEDSAVRELEKAISLEPGSGKNYYQFARLMEFYDKPQEAAASYEKALTCNPNAVEVMIRLAGVYEAEGQPDKALSVWKRMAEVEHSPYEQIKAVPEIVAPEYIFAHEAIGRQAETAGDKATAVREYRSALNRISRYQASISAMKAVLDANNRRDYAMESAVESVQSELKLKLKRLEH